MLEIARPPTRIAGWVPKLRADLEAMAKMLTATLKPWSGPKRIFAPEAYGHRGSTDVLATRAIQAAIDAAGKAGGGTVLLARGDYVSGTIVLRSNVRLEVAKGARLLASLDLKDYPEHVPQRPTVMDSNMGMNQSLIFAEACEVEHSKASCIWLIGSLWLINKSITGDC